MLSCPSCNSTNSVNHKFLYEKNGCAISRCSQCGLGAADIDNFDPSTYYTKEYFDGGHSDGYSDYVGSEPVLRAEFARIVRELKRHSPPGGRLLEIGSAYGFFLKEAQHSYEVHGIEIAKEAVESCHRAGLLNVHQGIANDDILARIGMVDAIVMLDVIEHLVDPLETLNLCNKFLKPGGVVLITTGDFGSITARLAGQRWRLMTPPQHLWFFTRRSFAGIASALNWRMISYKRPWKLVPLSLILFQVARMFGLNSQFSAPARFSQYGIPINLFDAMRVVLRKPSAKD